MRRMKTQIVLKSFDSLGFEVLARRNRVGGASSEILAGAPAQSDANPDETARILSGSLATLRLLTRQPATTSRPTEAILPPKEPTAA